MINDVDSEDEPEKANARHTEFLGGARQSECSEVEDTDGDPGIRRQACKKLELDDCKAMLRRVQEIERASAPGRHKEADTQMNGYAVAFRTLLEKSMPRIPRQNAPTRPSLPSNDAKSFQSVVAKETRMKQANDEQDSAQANLDERDLAASASKPRPGRPSVR